MKNIIIIALIVISVLINIFSFNKVHDWGDDFAGYVIQAKTIHTGNYSDLQANIEKNDFILNYPWGFPFLVSPVIKYFDSNIIIVKIYIYLFFLLALIVIFYLFRKNTEAALLTVLLVSSSPYFWDFKNNILADIPNLFFVLLTLFFSNRFLLERKTIINEYFTCFIIGVLIYISYMMRNQSIVLLPAIILVQVLIFRRDLFTLKRMLIIFIPILSFMFFVILSRILIPIKPVIYLDQYANLQLGKTVWENISYYVNVWKELFSTTDGTNNLAAVFTGFFITFVFVGVSTTLRQNILFVSFSIFSMMLVLITPFHQGVRYLIPLVPFFFYFFITGFRYAVFHIYRRKKFKQLVYYSVTGLIILLSIQSILVYSFQSLTSQRESEGPYKKTSVEMFNYIRNTSSKNEIIAFLKPRAMLLYTGRNCIVPLSYEECIDREVDYYVYYKNAINSIEQLTLESIQSHKDSFVEVFRNDDFMVFKVKRPPDS
jgi:hypothetical protein